MITISQQLKELLDTDSSEYRFTDWELEFLESVAKVGEPSVKQAAIIGRLWDDVFIRGKRGRL